MDKKLLIITALVLGLTACKSHYEVTNVERSRILVDSRYDGYQDAEAAAFLQYYTNKVDSIAGKKVGHVAKYMKVFRPECELSNLLADILVWAAKLYHEKTDFGVYNIGGIRADLPAGEVTYGNVLDVAPFENKIVFVTLSGEEVMELFAQQAANHGDGVSRGVELVITKDGKLVSAKLNGQPFDPKRDYRIVTNDYLLEGNDRMVAFLKSRNIKAPKEDRNKTRFIIMDYFREMEKQGRVVDAEIEGRVVIR